MNANLSSIIDMLPESIYWMDVNGRILGCNLNQARLIGVPDPAILIGKTLYEVGKLRNWTDSFLESVYQNNLEIMQNKTSRIIEEEVLLDGRLHYFLSFKNPWIGTNDEILGIAGIPLILPNAASSLVALNTHIAKNSKEESIHDFAFP